MCRRCQKAAEKLRSDLESQALAAPSTRGRSPKTASIAAPHSSQPVDPSFVVPHARQAADEMDSGRRLKSDVVRARVLAGLVVQQSIRASQEAWAINDLKPPDDKAYRAHLPELHEKMLSVQRELESHELRKLSIFGSEWCLSIDGSWNATANWCAHGCFATFVAHIPERPPRVIMVRLLQRESRGGRVKAVEKVVVANAKQLEGLCITDGLKRMHELDCKPGYVVVDGDFKLHKLLREYLPGSVLAADRNHLLRHVTGYFSDLSSKSKADLKRTAVTGHVLVAQQHETKHSRALDRLRNDGKACESDRFVSPILCIDGEYILRTELRDVHPLGYETTSARANSVRVCSICLSDGHTAKKCWMHNMCIPAADVLEERAKAYLAAKKDPKGIPAAWAGKIKNILVQSAVKSQGNRAVAFELARASCAHYAGDHTICAALSTDEPTDDNLPESCKSVSMQALHGDTARELQAMMAIFFGPDADPMLATGLMLVATTNPNEGFNSAVRARIGKGRAGARSWGIPVRGKYFDLLLGRAVWRQQVLADLNVVAAPRLIALLDQYDRKSTQQAQLAFGTEGKQKKAQRKRELRIFNAKQTLRTAVEYDKASGLPDLTGKKRNR